MKKITVTHNDAEQRLDRFLRKYLNGASLSYIYKIIRKDVKINGTRGKNETVIHEGDEITLYIPDDVLEKFAVSRAKSTGTRRDFKVAYEDENIIAVIKPFGLLTHGDGKEKKNTLVNQVVDYLIEKKEYNPRIERSFVPAAANRLDRNTTGLVLFGKNSTALRELNQLIRDKNAISKFYLTILAGNLTKELHLKGSLTKDESRNIVKVSGVKAADSSKKSISPSDSTADAREKGEKDIETIARPLENRVGYTLAEIQLITGRTHQIRAHMASAGYPVIGDAKYGKPSVNKKISDRFGLTTQLLHAYRLQFNETGEHLAYLKGKVIEAELPAMFSKVRQELF